MNNTHLFFRVVEDHGTSFIVTTEVAPNDQRIFKAEARGLLKKMDTLSQPTVGDWVKGTLQPGGWILIDHIEPRKNLLLRQSGAGVQKLGANLDYLFIATALNQNFNLNRIERYVVMALSCQIQPVILLTKVDLVEDPGLFLDQTAQRFPNVDVQGVSTLKNWNIEGLEMYLQPEVTAAIMGSSGVGKSTLVNHLIGSEVLSTTEIREEDGKGRHTTTHRSLHCLSNGAWLMDTPGLRALSLYDAEEGLSSLYQDIIDLGNQCKFGNCHHQSEPGCQIQKALESGQITAERWENYLKLQSEEAYQRRKTDKAEASKEKQKWKARNIEAKEHMKLKGRWK